MASQPIFCVGCSQNMKMPIALRTIAAVPYARSASAKAA